MNILPGLLLCCIIAFSGWGLSFLVPAGAVTISIILGMLIANIFGIPSKTKPGVTFSEKSILALAIALMGFSLDYKVLLSLGTLPLVLIVSGVPVTIYTALGLGRIFRINRDLALLVGTGNGICGSSAIAAAQGVIKTEEEHVGVSIAVINLLGTIGMILVPLLVSFFPDFSDQVKGMVIGNTLQAVGQVSAAGFSLGPIAGQTASVVKMGRVLLISPVVLLYSFIKGNVSERKVTGMPAFPGIPLFIVMFIMFSLVNTLGILPPSLTHILKVADKALLITAMAGIGMKISFKGLGGEGRGAVIVGSLTWLVQIFFSIVLIELFPAMHG